jgi:hypothetical protein
LVLKNLKYKKFNHLRHLNESEHPRDQVEYGRKRMDRGYFVLGIRKGTASFPRKPEPLRSPVLPPPCRQGSRGSDSLRNKNLPFFSLPNVHGASRVPESQLSPFCLQTQQLDLHAAVQVRIPYSLTHFFPFMFYILKSI